MKTLWPHILVGCLFVCTNLAGETLHKGRPIHLWLRDLVHENPEERVQAEKELRLIGTNVLPAMLSCVTSRGSAYSPDDSSMVVHSFRILGSAARPATPRLAELVNDPNYCNDACNALHLIGRESIPTFVRCLTNSNPTIREAVLGKLIAYGLETNYVADLQIALPPVRLLLKEKEGVSSTAMIALRVISTNANQFVADIIPQLGAEDATTRWCAVETLRIYGASAKAAIPSLLKIANDKNEKVRVAVAFAVQAIDPDAAKRSGIKVPVYE